MRRRTAGLIAVVVAALAPSVAPAQQLRLWVDATAARAHPPATVASAEPGAYGIAGLRLEGYDARLGRLQAAVQGGRAADSAGGAWFSGTAGTELRGQTGAFAWSTATDAFGLSYAEPFRYSAYGLGVAPGLAWQAGAVTLGLTGLLRRGRWRSGEATDLDDLSGPLVPPFGRGGGGVITNEAEGSLAVSGVRAHLGAGAGALHLRLDVERYDASNGVASGRYEGVGVDAATRWGPAELGAGVQWWGSPDSAAATALRREWGYHARVHLDLGARSRLNLHVGRTVADPLYGTDGSRGASLGLSVRLAGAEARVPAPVVEIGPFAAQGGRPVRFRIRAREAESAALAGDFNGWQATPMRRDGAFWTIELTLPPGLHHFGFILDGRDWVVPAHAPGRAEDGWGRLNASVLISPE